jgi:hypothetical protein
LALGPRPSALREAPDERPPILGTWPRLYGAVLAALALEVILFTILTRSFH